MLSGGFYHKSGLKIYFIFVIDMKSIGGDLSPVLMVECAGHPGISLGLISPSLNPP